MPDQEDVDTAIGIGNFIYDSIVPNANSPERILATQFAASRWTVGRTPSPQWRDRIRAAARRGRPSRSRRADLRNAISYSKRQFPSTLRWTSSRGSRRLVLPLLRNNRVEEVLPQLAVDAEIDHHGRAFSLVVNQELDALHRRDPPVVWFARNAMSLAGRCCQCGRWCQRHRHASRLLMPQQPSPTR